MNRSAKIHDTSATDRIISRHSGKRGLRIGLAVAAVLILAPSYFLAYPALKNWQSTERTFPRDRVRIAKVNGGLFEQSVTVDGKIVATVKPTLYSSSEGIITLHVEPGDTVTAGDIVAVTDNPTLDAELEQAKAALEQTRLEFKRHQLAQDQHAASSEQELKLARIRSEAASRKLARYSSRKSRIAVSAQELEAVQDEVLITQSEFESRQLETRLTSERLAFESQAKRLMVEQQESVVKELQRQVDDLSITSPITGQVGLVHVEERDSVAQNEPIMTIVDLTASGLELTIPETYANDLEVGMPVVITYEGRPFEGELTALSPEVVNSKFEARASFAEVPEGALKQRQRVSVRIIVDRKADALTVQRGPFVNSGGGRVAYRIDGDIAEAVAIELGAVGSSEVEILAGLSDGDEIIISNTDVFDNASRVLLR